MFRFLEIDFVVWIIFAAIANRNRDDRIYLVLICHVKPPTAGRWTNKAITTIHSPRAGRLLSFLPINSIEKQEEKPKLWVGSTSSILEQIGLALLESDGLELLPYAWVLDAFKWRLLGEIDIKLVR